MKERWERQQKRSARQAERRELWDIVKSYKQESNLRLLRYGRKWLRFSKTPAKDFGDQDVYGTAIPFSAGTFRHKCAYLWTTRLAPVVGAPDQVYAEEFAASFAVRVCEGQQGALLRVWMNGMLVLDRLQSGSGYASAPDFSNKIYFYNGSESQTASAVIEADKGAGNVPAYRGTCYLVCEKIPLGRFGNSLPEIECEVVGVATPDYTTTDVTGFTEPATANIQQWVISQTSPWMYQHDGGQLRCIRKDLQEQRKRLNVQAYLDSISSGLNVRTFIIEEGAGAALETIYFLCESATGDFILRFDGQWAHNYASRVNGRVYQSGIVHNGKVFISDGDEGRVYCFDKTSLAYLWKAGTGLNSVEAGTWTYDNAGRLWTVWYDSGAPDTLHLTAVTPGGQLRHFTDSASGNIGARAVMYETTYNILVTGGVSSRRMARIPLTAAGVPTVTGIANSRTTNNTRALYEAQRRFSKTFYTTNGTNLYARRLSASSWADVETIALSNYADTGTGTEAYGYDYLTRALWICRDAAPGMSMLPLNRDSGAAVTLDSLISSLCLDAGLVAGDMDVTAAAGVNVQGYTIQDQTTAKDPLTQLLTAHQFGVREHYENGYSQIKLEFIDRGASQSPPTIDEEDLGIGDGAPLDPVLGEEKTHEEALPRVVTVRYADTRRNYSAHHQKSEVPDDATEATEEIDLQFPNLVLSDDQAKQLADKILSSAWSEGTRYAITLPLEYLGLEPEDIAELTLGGAVYSVRIDEIELGANWILEVSATLAQSDLFVSENTGDQSDLANITPEVLTPSSLILVDCPAVRDVDGSLTDAGFYVFVSPQDTDDNWPGARVYRSLDGLDYNPVAILTNGATWGSCVDTLADGDVYMFDATSTVSVQLAHGSLSTQTESALSEDPLLNLAAIGSESAGWELVQFASVADNGDGTYTLSGMRRGRFGTEHLAPDHVAGETFVLFDFETPTTHRLVLGVQDRQRERFYKGVTVGESQSVTQGRSFTNIARSLMPYAPVEVYGIESGGDWHINLTRRTRIGGGLSDYEDTALNEETEEYEIDLRENSNSEVYRTLTIGLGLPALSGVNLSVDASLSKFVRASGSWITDGWCLGQRVESAGFSNAGNNGRWTISALTATDMTVTNGATTLVTEGAAAGRTMTATSPAVIYTAAMQTADGGAKSTFYAEAYQISATLRRQEQLNNPTAETGLGRGFTEQVLIS
jgi:hypothetical protein